jgi:hypothetical protein
VRAMEYYKEYLQGRRFILYIYHKPIETLVSQHAKTVNRLQLAIVAFNFKTRKDQMPADFFCQEALLKLRPFQL